MPSAREKPVRFDSYGLFRLNTEGRPVKWIEFSGDQQVLLAKLSSGHGVFGVEIIIHKPETAGAVSV